MLSGESCVCLYSLQETALHQMNESLLSQQCVKIELEGREKKVTFCTCRYLYTHTHHPLLEISSTEHLFLNSPALHTAVYSSNPLGQPINQSYFCLCLNNVRGNVVGCNYKAR